MADAPVARLDEFPAGYSLPGCSSALPASALPAGVTMLSGQPNSGHLRSVTYVSEHVLPMSSVQRPHDEGNLPYSNIQFVGGHRPPLQRTFDRKLPF